MKAPFRLGTTSFIYPAGWAANVGRLTGRVEDVELLFFETGQGALPRPSEIAELRALKERAGLTYSVHTPLAPGLASPDEASRKAAVLAVLQTMEAAMPLAPDAWILHVYQRGSGIDPPPTDLHAWRRRACLSLKEILMTGVEPAKICLESLDYDFRTIEPVLDELGLSAAIDLGHCRRDGRDPLALLQRTIHRARVVHWHGVDSSGKDHSSIAHWPREDARSVLRTLFEARYTGVLTLEVFGEKEFEDSSRFVAELLSDGSYRREWA